MPVAISALDQRLKILGLTFVFTDLKGSTELYERVGDLAAYDIVRSHFRILHEIVASERGAVVKTIGDAVMARFSKPDHALSAALRMRDTMRELNRGSGDQDLVLKIGIHEGSCLGVNLNGRQDYFGQTVNNASRVEALAETAASWPGDRSWTVPTRPASEGPEGRCDPQILRLRGVGERLALFELS